MDRETQLLLSELQAAVNQALLSSNRFGDILDLLERSGRDVSISVNATIDGVDDQNGLHTQRVGKGSHVELGWTADDQNFLRAMKIGLGEDD
jgi:hypothetical protein